MKRRVQVEHQIECIHEVIGNSAKKATAVASRSSRKLSIIIISTQQFVDTTSKCTKHQLELEQYLIAKFGLHDNSVELRVEAFENGVVEVEIRIQHKGHPWSLLCKGDVNVRGNTEDKSTQTNFEGDGWQPALFNHLRALKGACQRERS